MSGFIKKSGIDIKKTEDQLREALYLAFVESKKQPIDKIPEVEEKPKIETKKISSIIVDEKPEEAQAKNPLSIQRRMLIKQLRNRQITVEEDGTFYVI